MSAALVLLLLSLAPPSAPTAERVVTPNARFDVLVAPQTADDLRVTLRSAAAFLGPGRLVEVSIADLNLFTLMQVANTPPDEPLTRAARETWKIPVDVYDLCLFLDDVIAQNLHATGPVVLTPHAARTVGVLIHPDEVFPRRRKRRGPKTLRPHRYADVDYTISVVPPSEETFQPAEDNAPLGPRWHARYQNPTDEASLIQALKARRPNSDFADRMVALMTQLRAQGATVFVDSTARFRERGYLMYGAFALSQAQRSRDVRRTVRDLDKLQRRYGLKVPIRWSHPQGWRATVDAAKAMTEAYRVTYATRSGAMKSKHYDGEAFDLTALDLPRTLKLTAPDGEAATFDLSGADEPRDLNVSVALIRWIEAHFGFAKNISDYPHWNDAIDTP